MDAASDRPASPQQDADRVRQLRDNMVDSQVRPNKVTDPRIIAAMRRLPREQFLPQAQQHLAYLDTDIRLPRGRAMLAPMVIARLLQALAPESGERALVVGAGGGYGACVLAACGVHVTALEDDAELSAIARTTLAAFAPTARLVGGALADGWADGAPYDLILVEGAMRAIPPTLGRQLTDPAALGRQTTGRIGRLATVLALGTAHAASAGAADGQAVLAELTSAGLHAQPVFDCAAPLIPALLPPSGFSF